MKKIIFVILFCIQSLAQAGMGEVYFSTDKEINFQEEVEKLYSQEFSNSGSVLRLAMVGYAEKHEAVLDIGDVYSPFFDGDVFMYVDLKTNVRAGFGKGGAAYFGSTHLVPIWLAYPGTGMIEEIVGWLIVSDNFNLENELRTISIESIKDAQLFTY